MSTIWTPSGEQPVHREQPEPESGPADREEVESELRRLQDELANTPATVVVANHVMGMFELGALHLSRQPPNFADAQLAIDGMAALTEGLSGRLGEHESTLKDALAQIRLAFVQIRAATETTPPAPGAQPSGD